MAGGQDPVAHTDKHLHLPSGPAWPAQAQGGFQLRGSSRVEAEPFPLPTPQEQFCYSLFCFSVAPSQEFS